LCAHSQSAWLAREIHGDFLSLRSIWLVLPLLLAGACTSGRVTPEDSCRKVEVSGPSPNAGRLAGLVGKYDMTLVNSGGEYGDSVVHGTLVLWANDSARRYLPRAVGRLPGERPLTGSFHSESVTVPSYVNQSESEADAPAVEMIGATLYLGEGDATDAVGERLQVEKITPAGFVGTWTHSEGFSVTRDSATGRVVRDPSGYFCARFEGPREP
jgi:hypothetical protein